MSLLLQLPLGANVDGSGSSFHEDGRTSRDKGSNLLMGYRGRNVHQRSSTEAEAERRESWRMAAGEHSFYRTRPYALKGKRSELLEIAWQRDG